MKYNDYVLPPDDVLKKMRVEYQQKTETVNVLSKNKQEHKQKVLVYAMLEQFEQYCNFLEVVQSQTKLPLLRQKTTSILLKTKVQIEQLKGLYQVSNLTKSQQKNFYVSNKKPVGVIMYQEIKLLKALLGLQQVEKENSRLKLLNEMINGRLNNLQQLIAVSE